MPIPKRLQSYLGQKLMDTVLFLSNGILDLGSKILSFSEANQDGMDSSAKLKHFGLTQVPFIFLVDPVIEKLDETECSMRLPYNSLTKNHVDSMYFGTQAIGADACAAQLTFHLAESYSDYNVVPVFKSFKADFLKRAEGDMIFRTRSGEKIREMIARAISEKKRVTEMIELEGLTPDINAGEVVSRFALELSIKATAKSTTI